MNVFFPRDIENGIPFVALNSEDAPIEMTCAAVCSQVNGRTKEIAAGIENGSWKKSYTMDLYIKQIDGRDAIDFQILADSTANAWEQVRSWAKDVFLLSAYDVSMNKNCNCRSEIITAERSLSSAGAANTAMVKNYWRYDSDGFTGKIWATDIGHARQLAVEKLHKHGQYWDEETRWPER